jgi:hypothetical protein
VRVNSNKQTLILAGEPIPQRGAARSEEPRLTIVATRADETLLLAQGDFSPKPFAVESNSSLMTVAMAKGQYMLARSGYRPSTRGASFSAANEYARTQDLPGNGSRTALIDTYA